MCFCVTRFDSISISNSNSNSPCESTNRFYLSLPFNRSHLHQHNFVSRCANRLYLRNSRFSQPRSHQFLHFHPPFSSKLPTKRGGQSLELLTPHVFVSKRPHELVDEPPKRVGTSDFHHFVLDGAEQQRALRFNSPFSLTFV